VRSDAKDELESKGHLQAAVDIGHDAPRRIGDHYIVNLVVSVKPGPQFRISSISADGGPLLPGKDLSPFFTQKAGDIAGAAPFGKLAGQLRPLYWHYGYADVEIGEHQVLDSVNGAVSYHLDVTPGPLYHLRSLKINNLNAEQERKARAFLGMKPGDIYDEMAVAGLYPKLSADPTTATHSFTYTPAKDSATVQVDLTLDFYDKNEKSGSPLLPPP
jgi:outer membrane protein assembly factor BamA